VKTPGIPGVAPNTTPVGAVEMFETVGVDVIVRSSS